MSAEPQSEDSRETATMDISDDERGVSVVLGAVLMFGIAIIALTSFQAAIVPQENQQVEFNHYSEVQEDMQQLGAEIESASRDDVQSSQGIDLGTTYPTRAVAINPPPAAGQLQKTNTDSDFSGVDSKICGGGTDTFGVKYTPDYNELNAQEVHYENGQVFVKKGDDAAFLDKRTVIDTNDKTISLYRLVGDIPTGSEASEVNVRIVGTSSYGEGSLPAGTDLMVPSELNADNWKANLVDGSYGGTIENVNNGIEIKDIPSGYSVTCYVVALGEEEPPGDGAYGEDLAEDEDNDKIGTGGDSEYSDHKSATISSKGGMWTGIDKPVKIVFSDPKFSPTRAGDGQFQDKKRYFRTVLAITSDATNTRYYIDLGEEKGLRYDTDGTDEWAETPSVTIVRETETGTEEYSTDICGGGSSSGSDCGEEITPEEFINGEQNFNPLNLDQVYATKENDNDNKVDEYSEVVEEIRNELLRDDSVEVELFIADQHGRVRISLEEP